MNPESKFINGAIYTESDNILYSYKLAIQNKTFYDFKLIGKKRLNETVQSIHAIKQKGQNKVLVFYTEQRLQIFDDKLKQREANINLKKANPDFAVQEIVVQPMTVLLV